MNRNLHILHFYAEATSYFNQWQRFHFIDELQRAGHTISIFNPLAYKSIEEANEKLPVFISEAKPTFDVFINPAPSTMLYQHTIKKINAIGLPSILICFDNLHAPFIHKDIAPWFDLVWLTSWETEYLFRKWGCNTIFQPYAANPYTFTPSPGESKPGVAFIGTLYDDRVHRINQLTKNQIPCTIYSDMLLGVKGKSTGNPLGLYDMMSLLLKLCQFRPGRKIAYGRILNKVLAGKNKLMPNHFLGILSSVPFEKISSLYTGHALSINITELRDTFNLKPPVHKLHLRTFEIPMCGGLQIAPYVEELSNYFKDGEEIILCKDDDEFISKTQFYLRPEQASLRLKMKQKARLRAESEHTWTIRFTNVFRKLFG